MEEELISIFIYNQKKHVIKLIKNKKIVFFIEDEFGMLNNSLSLEEKLIFKKVYDSLQISLENSSFYRTETIGINSYNIYFDNCTHNYFWVPNNNNYNFEDNIKLNFKYNHELGIVFNDITSSSKERINNRMFNKIIKIGNKCVLILVTATIALNLLSGCTIQSDINSEIASETSFSETKEISFTEPLTVETSDSLESLNNYFFDEIKNIIKKNPYLSNEEKEFLYKLQFVFDEYHEYMDLAIVKERLASLKSEYQYNYFSAEGGHYNYRDNIIVLNANNFDEVKLSNFVHEFLHVLQKDPRGYGFFMCELSNEFFTREIMFRLYKENILDRKTFLGEYFDEYSNEDLAAMSEAEFLFLVDCAHGFSNGYKDYISIYYALAQIVSREVLLFYQFNPLEINTIKNALLDISGNTEENRQQADLLINTINDLRQYSTDLNKYIYYGDDGTIFSKLDYFYSLRNERNISDDIKLCSILCDCRQNEIATSSYLEKMYSFLTYKGFKDCDLVLSIGTFLSEIPSDCPVVMVFIAPTEIKLLPINDTIQQEYLEYEYSTHKNSK